MKKVLLFASLPLLLVAVAVVFTGCESAGIDGSQLPSIEIIGGEELSSLDFPSNGMSTKTITFSSNYDWSAKGSDEWIKVSPESGVAGEECQVEVSLEANDTYDLRNGNITLTIDKYSVDIAVTQQPKNGLTLSNSEIKLPQSGGAFDVTVLANVDFEYEIKANWIKAVTTRALTENKVRFEAEANSATDPRTGEIVFKGEGLSATLIVTQSQTNIITLSTSTIEMNGSGGEFAVDVSSNIDYKVAIESGCDWIQQLTTRAVTTSTLNFSVAKNETDTPRSATITVSGEGIKEIITVTQEYTKPTPQSNEIWYTSTNGSVERPYNTSTDTFGANIVSNTYKNGKGVITFDKEVTKIGSRAFYFCTHLTSVTIPDSVTSIGESAFEYCSSLTSVTIPDSVTSIGDSAFENCTSLTSINIPNRVLSIEHQAFRSCSSLRSITIPDSVLSIGENAFTYCTGELTLNCNIPNASSSSKSAFYNSKFTKITIGNNVTSIGNYAFYYCTAPTNITIPDSVISIGEGAFSNCINLISVTIIGNGATSIGGSAFQDCNSLANVTIGNGVTTVGERAFQYCESLTSVTIVNSVTSIGDDAFFHCTSLTDVNISDLSAWCKINFSSSDANPLYYAKNFYINGVLSNNLRITADVFEIKKYAFSHFSGLQSVDIPISPASIREMAFSDCDSLTSVTIGNGVTDIGEKAFYDCANLTNVVVGDIGGGSISIGSAAFAKCNLTDITIGDGVKLIGSNAFDSQKSKNVHIFSLVSWCNISFENYSANPLYQNGNLYMNRELVTELSIPSNVTQINDYAFYNCASINKVTISNNVISIGNSAFYNCIGLTSADLGNSVKSIGISAFRQCIKLEQIVIPESVTSIGNYAFLDCTSSKATYIKAKTPPAAGGTSMFGRYDYGLKIYVPRNSVSAYKSAQYWSGYASYIYGYDF